MSPRQRRFAGVVNHVGETATIAGSPVSAIVSAITPGQARQHLTDATIASLSERPIYTAYVPYNTAVAVDDTITWLDTSRIVAKVIELRVAAETVALLLVLT